MSAKRGTGEGTIYHRKDGRWAGAAYVRTVSQRRKRVTVYGRTRAEAHTKLITLMDTTNKGIPRPDAPWRVDTYLDYWLAEVIKPNRREKTWELYEMVARLHIKPFIGSKSLSKLGVPTVQMFLNDQVARGCSPRTVQLIRTTLSSALSRAVKEELVNRNVAQLVDVPHWERKDVTPWTVDQARQFLQATQSTNLCLPFHLLVYYGLRRGEVLGLRWCDIDFTRDTIFICQQVQRYRGGLITGPVKTAAGKRFLPLIPTVRAQLVAYHLARYGEAPGNSSGNTELLFTSATGRPIEPNNFVRSFHAIRDRAGLPRISVHYLRHTTATLLKNLGVPPRDAQLILGHAQISTTQQLYQHADLIGQRSAILDIAAVLDRIEA
jgi:integrase